MNRYRRQAFSVAELLIAITITALLLGVVLVNLRAPRDRAGSQGAAVLLQASLRQAREQAISQRRTVAIALPSSNGTLSHCSGYYFLEGETRPQISSRVSLLETGAGVFCGQYSGPSWTTSYPSNLSTENFALSSWSIPYPQDHLIAFLPNGQAISDLPLGNGAYRLVVGKSFSYSNSAPANLSDVELPRTILVTPAGDISESQQLADGSGVSMAAGNAGPGALLPGYSSAPNQNPQFVSPFLKVSPEPNATFVAAIAPSGSTATVPLNGLLTFTVYASDPNGDQLWCKWTGPGNFASQDGARMLWNEELKAWQSSWTWRLPQGAVAGTTYPLNCEVYDNRGGVTSPVDIQMPRPTAIPRESLLVAMGDGVYIWNWDGSAARRIVAAADVGGGLINRARWSPDYSQISLSAGSSLWVCSPDGNNLQQVASFGMGVDAVCWDRDGLAIYAVEGNKLHQLSPDPTAGIHNVLLDPVGLSQPPASLSMHPQYKLMVTSDTSGKVTAFWLPDAANPAPASLAVYSTVLPSGIHTPVFDKTGTRLYFRSAEPQPAGISALSLPVTVNGASRSLSLGLTPTTILNASTGGTGFSVSPDGQFVASVLPGNRLAICPVNGSNADLIDVTAVPGIAGRTLMDVDWGNY